MIREEVLNMGTKSPLVGVYTPGIANESVARPDLAVVMLNSGLIHHVGPHRLHTILGRTLAQQGISTLRVDFSGTGDSPVTLQDLPPDEIIKQELCEILNALMKKGHSNFLLFGICSGAKHALEYSPTDTRIKGIVLVNAAAKENNADHNTEASAKLYLKHSIKNARAWINLFTGRVNYGQLFRSIAGHIKNKLSGSSDGTQNIAEKVRSEINPVLKQGSNILVVLSDRHAQVYSLYEKEINALIKDEKFKVSLFPDEDHLFTSLEGQAQLINSICTWTKKLTGADETDYSLDIVSEGR